MNHDKRVRMFGYELRRSLIEKMVMELPKIYLADFAMFYFEDDRELLAKQLAEKLHGSTSRCEDFFEKFRPLPWSLYRIYDDVVWDALYLPEYHAASDEPKQKSK